MKKLFFCSLFLVFLSITAQSQIRFGIKGGVSTTNLSTNNLNILGQGGVNRLTVAVKNANYGINFGVVTQIEIANFFLQPELNFNSTSTDFQVNNLQTPTSSGIFREKYKNLDIPVLLGWRLGPLRLNAGPEGHVFLNSTSDLFKFSDYKQTFSGLTLGWLGGVGLDIWNLMIDVRYEGNFTKYGSHINFGGTSYQFDKSPSRFLFSVGWMFGKR